MLRYVVGGLVLVVGSAVVWAGGGQETVTLRAARPKEGDRIRVTRTEKSKAARTVASGGKSATKEDEGTRTIVYVDEITTAGNPQPTKLKRTYEKFEVTGRHKGEPTPPLNTPITIEKMGGKYTFTTDDKPMEGPFAATLASEFGKKSGPPKPEDVFPGGPVKVGDTWKIDGTQILAFAGDETTVIDADKSSATGKLLKTYQKDEKQFAVLELTGEIAIRDLMGKVPLKVKPDSKIGLKMTADMCVNGIDPLARTDVSLSIKLVAESGAATLTLDSTTTTSETRELLKKP